jgi:exopolysaccharide production protein ExoZ
MFSIDQDGASEKMFEKIKKQLTKKNGSVINLEGRKLYSIQYLRAVAIIFVVLTHSGVYLNQVYHFSEIRSIFTDYFSYFGVVIFFCISGFLLTGLSAVNSWRSFVLHRIARIYPIYLIVLLLAVSAYSIYRPEFPSLDWRAVTLLPFGAGVFRPLHIEWTLVFEVTYYALLSLFCISFLKKYLPVFLLGWLVLLSWAFLTGETGGGMLPNAHQILLSSWNICFVMGGLSYYMLKHDHIDWWAGFLGCGLLFSCTISAYATAFMAPAGVSLLLAYFTHLVIKGKFPIIFGVLNRLGNWSYVIFLTHVPIQLIILPIFLKRGLSPMSAWFSVLGIILMIGGLIGQLDIRMYRDLKNHIHAGLKK